MTDVNQLVNFFGNLANGSQGSIKFFSNLNMPNKYSNTWDSGPGARTEFYSAWFNPPAEALAIRGIPSSDKVGFQMAVALHELRHATGRLGHHKTSESPGIDKRIYNTCVRGR